MCIAIFKPKGKIVPMDYLRTAFENNSDGAGFLAHDEQLIARKGFFSFQDFWDAYSAYEKDTCVLHFRIRTSGLRDEKNCHPFLVNENLGFVHNGVIQINRPKEEFSDTWYFNILIQHFVHSVPSAWSKDKFKSLFYRLSDKRFKGVSLGSSKFIFLDSQGSHAIFNERAGMWENGIWYSNASYKANGSFCSLHRTVDPYNYDAPGFRSALSNWRDKVFQRAPKGIVAHGGSDESYIDIRRSSRLPSKFEEEASECVRCGSIVPTAMTLNLGHGHKMCVQCASINKYGMQLK